MVQKLTDLNPLNYPKNLREQVPQRLKDRVTFIGAVSHLELQTYLQEAAVLLNPSLSEAFGMSLVEAAASGIPVIATQVGGMTDVVVPGETGLLVPADDPQALAEAMGQLLSDKDQRQRMGLAGRVRAVEKFSWEANCYRFGGPLSSAVVTGATATTATTGATGAAGATAAGCD